MDETKTVSVLGLGGLGEAIAGRLLDRGARVTVWNRTAEKANALAARGAQVAVDPAAAFSSEVTLSVLFDDAAVREVFLASDLLDRVAARTPGALHVCLSTISPPLADELARAHADRGLALLGAPVFGRPPAAAAGTLNVLVAGASEDIARAAPAFALLGKAWPVGSAPRHAYAMKIAGNFLGSAAIESMAESAALVGACGGDPAVFLDFIVETLFDAPIYRFYAPVLSGRRILNDASTGFAIPLKDNALAQEAARAAGLTIPLATLLRASMLEAQALGPANTHVGLAEAARKRTLRAEKA